MNCEQFKENILEFLYDEVPPPQRADMSQHLSGCAACNADVNELKLVRNELAEWKDPATRTFPVTVPYPSLWALLRQWLFPTRWSWQAAITCASVTGFIALVTFSILGTQIEVSRDGFAFRADLLRRDSPPPNATPTRGTSLSDQLKLASTSALPGRPDRPATLQDVATLIQESETRQQSLIKEEEMRLTDQLASGYRTQFTNLAKSMDNKHRLDLVAIYNDLEQQRLNDLQKIRMTFSSLDERTSQQAQQTQQLVDLIQKASYQPK